VSGRRFDFYGENARAYNSREPELLLAGPAGCGKSVVLLTKCLTLLDKYPGCRGLFCRGTRASLTQSGLVTWEQDVLGVNHPVLLTNPVKRRVRQSYELPNGSELIVAGLDDPGKTLSAQYDFVYIQEATEEGVELDTYTTLFRSLRNPVMSWHQIMLDCNPTTPVHWLFQRSRPGGKLTRYQSTHKDNPRFFDRARGEWTADGRAYLATLDRYTGHLRKRFLDGIWAAAEGLVFDGFETEVHLLPEGWTPPAGWARVWSIDWGFTSPLVLQLWAVDGDGRMYLYRELYRTQVRATEAGEWAKGEVDAGREPPPRAIVCDHDPLMKAEFDSAFGYMTCDLADKKDLLAGIQVVQERFAKQADDRPRIYFARNAVVKPDARLSDAGRPASTVDELSAYIWDKNSVKDQPLDKDNHGADACRYATRWVNANLVGIDPNYQGPTGSSLLPEYMGQLGSATGWK
jgi:phage terminase large subunit